MSTTTTCDDPEACSDTTTATTQFPILIEPLSQASGQSTATTHFRSTRRNVSIQLQVPSPLLIAITQQDQPLMMNNRRWRLRFDSRAEGCYLKYDDYDEADQKPTTKRWLAETLGEPHFRQRQYNHLKSNNNNNNHLEQTRSHIKQQQKIKFNNNNHKLMIRLLVSQRLFIISVLLVLLQTSQQFSLIASGGDEQAIPNSRTALDGLSRTGPWAKLNFASAHLNADHKTTNRDHQIGTTPKGRANFRSRRQLNASSSTQLVEYHEPELNAYRYDLMSEPVTSDGKLASFQFRLDSLRRQLEGESSKLGSPCLRSSECSRNIANSHCKSDSNSCSCLPYHVEYNSTTCLPPALLGFACQIDAQCHQKVQSSVCVSGTCSCLENHVPYRKDKCLGASEINQFCLADKQCHLADQHSYCKWKIPNIYGVCKCPPNYLIVEKSPRNESNYTRCAPRLGDSCSNSQECLLSTRNSVCREPSQEDSLDFNHFNWKTSGITKQRCFCREGFRSSKNKIECQVAEIATRPPEVAPVKQQDQKHAFDLLERGNVSEYHKFMDSVLNGRKSTQQATLVQPTTATTQAPTTPKLTPEVFKNLTSSLGKRCSSKLECQARDKYSDCVDGICECLRPTERCSSRATGCHRNTFQCRNGQCISWYFVCDSFRNCDDGSDEEDCSLTGSRLACPRETFQCHSGGFCLSLGKLCNGKRECPDGSDELNCGSQGSSKNGTSLGMNEAKSSGNNGAPSRPSVGPTDNKQFNNSQCHPSAFACANGQCLPGYAFCNAIEECQDGSDEPRDLCSRELQSIISVDGLRNQTALGPGSAQASSTLAHPGQLQQQQPTALRDSAVVKVDKKVIEELLRRRHQRPSAPRASSGRERIARSAPEAHRVGGKRRRHAKLDPSFQPAELGECPRWSFTCRNGRCRSNAILCSGVDGCGDNSDEDRCEVCKCEAP